MGREKVIDLPPVRLRDVGKSRGGMTGGEIASLVLKQITDATVASAARGLAQEGAERLKEDVKADLKDRRRR